MLLVDEMDKADVEVEGCCRRCCQDFRVVDVLRTALTEIGPPADAGVGNCHVHVDKAADPTIAELIVLDSKARRPSVFNAPGVQWGCPR